MILTDYPLKVPHEYVLPADDLSRLRKFAASDDPRLPKEIAPLRLASLPVAGMLVRLLAEELGPASIVISAFGIREGVLYSLLNRKIRRQDPLIAALDDSGHHDFEAFADGFVLDRWIEESVRRRARSPAHPPRCLPDRRFRRQGAGPFRAERAIEAALHGNWPAIDAPARVALAQALRSTFGRTKPINAALASLCSEEELIRAHEWGLALRLALRFSGGASPILKTSRLIHDGSSLRLLVPPTKSALVTEVVQRRLLELGHALGLGAVIAAA
jgi:exopolyphosphatase/guanosine-5'-triphosphate,3'-diphosphate pyrophosphatase